MIKPFPVRQQIPIFIGMTAYAGAGLLITLSMPAASDVYRNTASWKDAIPDGIERLATLPFFYKHANPLDLG